MYFSCSCSLIFLNFSSVTIGYISFRGIKRQRAKKSASLQEKKELEEKLSGGEISNKELQEASLRIGEVMALLDEKEMRWLELNDN